MRRSPGSLEDVAARGNRWLRYPPALEAPFRDDALEPRRELQLICAVIGIVGVLVGSANIEDLSPDIAEQSRTGVNLTLAIGTLPAMGLLVVPRRLRRTW